MTNRDWAILVLRDGGWPVNETNITTVLQWMASENDPSTWTGTAGANNPLNNGLGSGGGAGLGSYPDLTVAAQQVANNIKAGNYGYSAMDAVLSQSAGPVAFEHAAIASSWANGHYGGGSGWHNGPVAVVSAAQSAQSGATKGVNAGTGIIGDVANAVGGAVSTVAGAVVNAIPGVSTVSSVGGLITDITSPTFWKRIGMGAFGVGLFVIGMVVFFEGTDTGQKVTSSAVSGAAMAAVA